MPHPRLTTAPRRRLATALARAILPTTLALLPVAVRAQDAARPSDDECWRFAFGAWTPALDARAAGHERDFPSARPSGMISGRAPDGGAGARDWASRVGMTADSTLMLFPSWWAAGVELAFPAAAMRRDTLRGRAIALVADARSRNPVAPVVAWRVSCSARDRSPAPPVVVADSAPRSAPAASRAAPRGTRRTRP